MGWRREFLGLLLLGFSLVAVVAACAPARSTSPASSLPSGFDNSLRSALADLSREQPTIARAITGFPWFADGLSARELAAAGSLVYLGRTNPAAARALLPLPWLRDGLAERDLAMLQAVEMLPDATLAVQLAQLEWFRDGFVEREAGTLYTLFAIAQRDSRTASLVARSPFFESFEGPEFGVMRALLLLEQGDPAYLNLLRAEAWFNDGLTEFDAQLVTLFGEHGPRCASGDYT